MATLQSKIRLCKGINVDKNYVNVLDYTESQMLSLCESQEHLVASANDYSFIRNKGSISTNFNYSDALQSNYIAFQNKDYSNKWFFAWIDDVIYNGEENTEIKYTIDVWSTWFSYWNSKSCYVIREHVNDDIVGKYTQPEGLELGEYIIDGIDSVTELNELVYVLRVNKYISSGSSVPLATNYGGVYCAGGAYVFDNIQDMVTVIQAYGDGFNDALIDAYMVPKAIIATDSQSLQYPGQNAPYTINKYIDKPTTLNSYSPVNKKLLTFPYCYLNMDNNNGSTNSLMYELFGDLDEHTNQCAFEIKGVPVIGTSIKCCPQKYKNSSVSDVESEGIMSGKFPTLSWSQDEYTNWLTQNAVNIGVGITTDVLGLASSLATGNVATGVSSSLSMANRLGQFYQHSLVPFTSKGNTNGGDINVSSSANTFYFYKMSIREEYAKIIDDYFTRFGYKINRIKTPNITGRTYWNYVEIGSSEDIGYGDVPSNFMEIINNACRKGVTIWHNHSNIGNFALNNTIVQ
jgi:hypothetical protein